MNKKQKFKRTALIFSILAIAIFLFAGGGKFLSVVTLPPSYLFYGESDTIITGLTKVSTGVYSSTYWDCISDKDQLIGDDGFLKSETNGGNRLICTTKNTFGKGKDFRATTHISGGFSNNGVYEVLSKINGGSVGEIIGTGKTHLFEIKSSPVVDTIQTYLDGQLVGSGIASQPFKVEIVVSASGSQNDLIRVGIENPAYKDPYSCIVKPDEQYYKFYFMEGSTVSKSRLENFNHWCLDTSPLEIYTPMGKRTDDLVIVALEEGNSYPVPAGQIWAVEYVGDKKQLVTPCEQDEVLLNGNECKARTVLELQFLCAGGTLNTATGECIPSTSNQTTPPITLQTQAVDYIKSDIQTYQFLAENSKFRFTVIQDDNTMTASFFDLLGTQFVSEIPTSFSSASFSWGDKSGTLIVGEVMPLDERLKVRLSRVELQAIEDVGVGDTQKFLVEWTFELDTSFLVPSYDASKKEIIITNSYHPFTGGLSITKKNNLGVTTTESKRTEFLVGETRIPIDTSGLLQFSVRPFIEIITPDAEFRLATAIPMTVSDLQETQAIVNVPTQTTTKQIVPLEKIPEGGKGEISAQKSGLSFGMIAGIIGGILAGLGMVFFIIRFLIKLIRKR